MASPEAKVRITAVDKTRAAFRSAQSNMTGLRSSALRLGAVLSGGLFTLAVKNSLDFADGLDKAAKAAGISTGFLQEMRFAGDQLGVSNRLVDEGFRRFTRRLGEFVNSGGGPAATAITKLGISVRDLDGNFRGSEAVFDDFVEAMSGLSSEAEKGAYAAQIFGDDAGPKLRLLLDQGTSGIRKLKQEAHDIGAVLSADVIDNSVKAKDSLAKLSNIVRVQLTEALTDVAPLIVKVGNAFIDLAKQARVTFGDLNSLSASLLIRKLEDLDARRDRTLKRLSRAEKLEGDNSFLGTAKQLISADAETIRQELKRVDADIVAAELSLGARNYETLFSPKPNFSPFDYGTSDDTASAKKRLSEAEKQFEEDVKNSEAAVRAENAAYVEWQTTLDETAQALREQLNPLEALETKLASLDTLLAQDKISWNTYSQAVFSAMDESESALDIMNEKTEEVGKGALDMGFAFESAFEKAALSGEKFSEVLKALGRDLAQIVLRQTVTDPLGTSVSKGISKLFPGFATGGDFTVGGYGGTDSQLVAFRATPGERVSVRTPGQGASSGQSIQISIDARGAESGVETKIRAAMNIAIQEAKNQVFASIERGGIYARAVGRTS